MTADKRKEQIRRNYLRLKNCRLHNFDWKDDIKRYKQRRRKMEEETGVALGNLAPIIFCRCKNCGGKVPIDCAVGYMDALEHIAKIKEESNNG